MSETTKAAPSPPVEIRYFLRNYTMDDAAAGINPVRLTIGAPDSVTGQQRYGVYAPQPILQYRYREIVYVDSVRSSQWSAWQDCAVVKDGE